jgi:transcriptional regulator with XRE-family HTH domain
MGAANRINNGTSAHMLGRKIRALRREAGLSLRELGAAVGVSLVQLQRYETGVSPLSTSRLLVIAQVLGVRAAGLLGELNSGSTEDQTSRREEEERELTDLFARLTDPVERRAILNMVRAAAGREGLERAGNTRKSNEFFHSRSETK